MVVSDFAVAVAVFNRRCRGSRSSSSSVRTRTEAKSATTTATTKTNQGLRRLRAGMQVRRVMLSACDAIVESSWPVMSCLIAFLCSPPAETSRKSCAPAGVSYYVASPR